VLNQNGEKVSRVTVQALKRISEFESNVEAANGLTGLVAPVSVSDNQIRIIITGMRKHSWDWCPRYNNARTIPGFFRDTIGPRLADGE